MNTETHNLYSYLLLDWIRFRFRLDLDYSIGLVFWLGLKIRNLLVQSALVFLQSVLWMCETKFQKLINNSRR